MRHFVVLLALLLASGHLGLAQPLADEDPDFAPVTSLVVESAFTPPPCTGIFTDVPCAGAGSQFATWIEQLFRDGISSGCSATTYCPDNAVTRRQMAVFLERAMRGTANWQPHTVDVYAVKASDGSPDPVASGQALLAGMASIPPSGLDTPSASNPWLVRIGPGVFDLATNQLTVMPFVSLQGAGRLATIVTRNDPTSSGTLVINAVGPGEVELRNLAVTNPSPLNIATGIRATSASLTLRNVTVSVTGGADGTFSVSTSGTPARVVVEDCAVDAAGPKTNVALQLVSGFTGRVDSTTIGVASSTGQGFGIRLVGGNAISLHDVTISGVAGLSTFVGISTFQPAGMELVDVTVEAVCPSGTLGATAVDITGTTGSPEVKAHDLVTRVNRTGGTCACTGLALNAIGVDLMGSEIQAFTTGISLTSLGAGVVARIHSSEVSGGTESVSVGSGSAVQIGSSRLGGTVSGAGTKTCAGNYRASDGVFFASTCP